MKKLLKFEADWCGPCKVMKPIAKELADKYSLDIASVDIDLNPEIAKQYNVMSIPTLVLLEDDKEIGRSVGAMPVKKVAQNLNLELP